MNEVRAIGSGFFEVEGKLRCFLCVRVRREGRSLWVNLEAGAGNWMVWHLVVLLEISPCSTITLLPSVAAHLGTLDSVFPPR